MNKHMSPLELDFFSSGFLQGSQNQVGFDKQILSSLYLCLHPLEVSLQLRNLPKNIYKYKCHENEINTIFKSPCLFTKNVLIHFKYPLLVYEEYFNVGCLFTLHIKRYLRLLHFTSVSHPCKNLLKRNEDKIITP